MVCWVKVIEKISRQNIHHIVAPYCCRIVIIITNIKNTDKCSNAVRENYCLLLVELAIQKP